jgi:hypothetical protein
MQLRQTGTASYDSNKTSLAGVPFMHRSFLTHLAAAATLCAALSLPALGSSQATTTSADQDHVVSSQAMQQQVENTSAARQKNIEILNNLVATPTAQKAMHDAKIDPQQVKNAIPTLGDHDLANLAARATNAQQEFAAGHIGPGLFTVLVLVVILIIIVIVVH